MSRLAERLWAWRDRWVANPGFQRWAMRLPFTRPIARHRARRLFELATATVTSQVLAAVVELDLPRRLAAGPVAPDDLASALDLDPDALRCLVVAAEGLGLVRGLADGRVALGMTGAELLAHPGVPAMVRHHRLLARDLAEPVAFLRRPPGGGELARFWVYAGGRPEGDVAPYSELMAVSQPLVAEQALAAYPFARHRQLLDVGGGDGAFVAAVAARHPRLGCTLFDLPPVVARARSRLAPAVGDRIRVVGGDFRVDPLPPGADLVTLVRILHDHEDAVAAALLGKVRRALVPGGRVLVVEPMAGTRGAGAVAAYFSFYLRAMGSGRPRTKAELARMLREAGFVRVREHAVPLPLIAQVLSAISPRV